MNIFVLSNDPGQAAKDHCDKHVVKMVLETAQLLSTACREAGAEDPLLYKSSHVNHPCSVWARSSISAFCWLCDLGTHLSEEYSFRYGKTHKSQAVIERAKWYALRFPNEDMPPFVQCVPEEYKRRSAVTAYRAYYKGEKANFARWTRRPEPKWWRQ